MKTVCPFCGAYRYDSQQMSGVSTHTHTKYIIPKTGAECNSPAPKKRKKHPDLPECFSHRPAAMPQQVGQAHRSAPHKIPHKSPALPDFYPSASGHVPQGTFSCPSGNSPCVPSRPCRAGARGLSPPVSPEPGAYLRGTASPLEGEGLSRATLPHARPCAAARAAS